MARFFCPDLPNLWHKGCRFFLAGFWVSGFLCGILVYLSAGRTLVSLMRSTPMASVSIVGMLCVTTLPFLFSATAVFLSKPVLLLPICFGKAFLFAFVSMGIFQAFGSAGWLFRWLLLFSDCASVPVLYWFWLRHISGDRPLIGWEAAWLCSLAVLTGSIHFSVISPFLAGLIEF
ncbi:MAG: hypothetical protein ACI3VX_04595 [Faecousia sp.]